MDGIEPKPLETQVAGRHRVKSNDSENCDILDTGTGFVLKRSQTAPRGPREISFYETVFNPDTDDSVLLKLQTFLPKFYQCIELNGVKHLKLENLTHNFKHPAVMDVKIGAITWDPDAPQSKIDYEKSKFPIAEKIGIRIGGFKVYNPDKDSYDDYDKNYSYSLTEDTVADMGFGKFLSQAKDRQQVIRFYIEKLKDIENWFLTQRKFSFYSTSLLFVYECSSSSVNNISNNSLINHSQESASCSADVRMIDFAHVFPSESIDENYLNGLRHIIQYLTQLL